MILSVVILAAGQGKRMHSRLPKVLHKLAGKTLLEHVTETAAKLDIAEKPIVIYGHQGELVRHTLAHLDVTWVLQTEQLGTGHALQQALPHLPADGRVLVLYGDIPLISETTLRRFIMSVPHSGLGVMTAKLENPTGLGRIIRDHKNQIMHIIEEKDATELERAINEINTGIYLIPVQFLQQWLPKLQNKNAQHEYYLTDIIQMAVQDKISIHDAQPGFYQEISGVNDCAQLAELERFYQKQQAEKFMRHGVILMDPNRFDVRGDVQIGQDVIIDVNVILEGRVSIGNHCVIGPNVVLRNTTIGNDVEIKANTLIDGAEISEHSIIGPFARIRPGTVLSAHAHIGNFVEIKNSFIYDGTKINHLSYIGDSEIGKRVNIGAGTITCNYDGVNKHRTTIGDNVFVGSNTSLVAPITINDGATIGAGSTITKNAPANQLTLCRAEQRSIENWQRPKKKEKES